MTIRKIKGEFVVCQVSDLSGVDLASEFCFTGKTDEEFSLVCKKEDVPKNTLAREDGWCMFRIEGVLEFSQIGIIAKISGLLSEEKIPIFVVSTFNTDYFLVKKEHAENALCILRQTGGYAIAAEEPAMKR